MPSVQDYHEKPMNSRERLHNRRLCETRELRHGGHHFALTAGFFTDGRLAEIFLSSRNHVGSPLEAIARDAAVTVSIALQFGADIETIRAALTRDHDGGPATALGDELPQRVVSRHSQLISARCKRLILLRRLRGA